MAVPKNKNNNNNHRYSILKKKQRKNIYKTLNLYIFKRLLKKFKSLGLEVKK